LNGQRAGLEDMIWKLAGKPTKKDEEGKDKPNEMLVHPVEAIRALIQDVDQRANEWLI
jgi:hypothetical protein